MRNDIDKLIEETLSAEDRELLDRYGAQQGFFAQAISAFRGPTSWLIWVIYIAQIVFFLIGTYLAWRFFEVRDVTIALRYGLSALLMFLMGAIMKIGMGIRMETDRAIREVKRLELQVAILKAKTSENA